MSVLRHHVWLFAIKCKMISQMNALKKNGNFEISSKYLIFPFYCCCIDWLRMVVAMQSPLFMDVLMEGICSLKHI